MTNNKMKILFQTSKYSSLYVMLFIIFLCCRVICHLQEILSLLLGKELCKSYFPVYCSSTLMLMLECSRTQRGGVVSPESKDLLFLLGCSVSGAKWGGIYFVGAFLIFLRCQYRKVASSRLSWLVTHASIFRMFMKVKF